MNEAKCVHFLIYTKTLEQIHRALLELEREITDESESLLMGLLATSEINEYVCLYCRATVQCRAQNWA